MNAYDTFKFEHAGREFRASLYHDDDATPPWKRSDGHGAVSEYTRRDKKPGERILCATDHSYKRLYDYAGAIALAKRDGWGLSDDDKAALAANLGRVPTAGEVRAAAVEKDFDFLQSWCNDDWHYCGVAVQLLNDDGEPVGDEFTHALWGIESNADDHIKDVACELAEQVPGRLHILSADMAKLGKALHDALDAEGDTVGGLRDMADSLQQMAADIIRE